VAHITVFKTSQPGTPVEATGETARMTALLAPFGVTYEAWEAAIELPDGADQDTIIKAYERDIERLKAERGYKSVDVVRMTPDNPQKDAARTKFLDEHRHAEDEVRFFVEGAGAFYLRDDETILKVVCERGDLLSVPAGTRHWFDMGDSPYFCAIRLFTTENGWVADFTGDQIAKSVPEFDRQAESA